MWLTRVFIGCLRKGSTRDLYERKTQWKRDCKALTKQRSERTETDLG